MTWPCNCFRGTDPAVEPVDTPGKSFALVPDTLGNVIANKDVNGDMVRTCEYWPYGEIRTETDSNPTPFGYGGTWGYYSDPSGMLYVRARTYKPVEGRWLTVDPLWPGESAYGYCACEPTVFTDPDGMAGQGCTGTNFMFCQAKCVALGGVKRCVQDSKTKKMLFCTCKNKPPIGKGGIGKILGKIYKSYSVYSWICRTPCFVAMIDCVYDLNGSIHDIPRAICDCYKGYKEERHQGNWLQDKLFDLSCGLFMRALQLYCEGKISVEIDYVEN